MPTPKQTELTVETKKLLSEQGTMKDFVMHPGWKLARGKLLETISQLQDASTIDLSLPASEVVHELATRRTVAVVLYDWIRDMEGTAAMADSFRSLTKDSYVRRH
jgi:hypothetical protein